MVYRVSVEKNSGIYPETASGFVFSVRERVLM